MENPKLQKLKEMMKLVNESLTREEFVSAFKEVIKLTKDIESKLIQKIDGKLSKADIEIAEAAASIKELKQEFQRTIQETKEVNETTFANVKKRTIEAIDTLFMKMRLNEKFNEIVGKHEQMTKQMNEKIEKEMEEMYAEHEAMMEKMEEKMPDTEKMMEEMMAKMPPETPESIRDKLETLKDEERLDAKYIKGLEDLEKRINDKISAIPRGMAPRSSNAMKPFPLTPDGSTKTFTVPKGVAGFVVSSDFPFIYTESTGYTINASRTQIVLQVDNAPTAQSTLLYVYSSMFN